METYKTKSVCVRVPVDVLQQIPTRHPIRNELEGGNSYAPEGDDVHVLHVLPCDSLLVRLLGPFENDGRERKEWIAYLLNPPWVPVGINPDLLDANLATVEGPFVDIGDSSGGDRVGPSYHLSA